MAVRRVLANRELLERIAKVLVGQQDYNTVGTMAAVCSPWFHCVVKHRWGGIQNGDFLVIARCLTEGTGQVFSPVDGEGRLWSTTALLYASHVQRLNLELEPLYPASNNQVRTMATTLLASQPPWQPLFAGLRSLDIVIRFPSDLIIVSSLLTVALSHLHVDLRSTNDVANWTVPGDQFTNALSSNAKKLQHLGVQGLPNIPGFYPAMLDTVCRARPHLSHLLIDGHAFGAELTSLLSSPGPVTHLYVYHTGDFMALDPAGDAARGELMLADPHPIEVRIKCKPDMTLSVLCALPLQPEALLIETEVTAQSAYWVTELPRTLAREFPILKVLSLNLDYGSTCAGRKPRWHDFNCLMSLSGLVILRIYISKEVHLSISDFELELVAQHLPDLREFTYDWREPIPPPGIAVNMTRSEILSGLTWPGMLTFCAEAPQLRVVKVGAMDITYMEDVASLPADHPPVVVSAGCLFMETAYRTACILQMAPAHVSLTVDNPNDAKMLETAKLYVDQVRLRKKLCPREW